MNPKSRSVVATVSILLSLVAIAVLVYAAPAPAVSEEAVFPASGAANGLGEILPQATIHCCAQGAADACRTQCKELGPGCKGQIGCRAGECVCTCTCP